MTNTDADKMFHSGWATNDQFGATIIKELGEGKDDTDAPVLLDFMWVTQRLSHLEGKILTLIEATVNKDNQKSTKDIVRDYVGTLYAEITNTTHTDEYMEYLCNLCSSQNQSESK